MRLSQMLQLTLSVLLAGFCLTRHTSTEGAGRVPVSHLKMLSLGLSRFLRSLGEKEEHLAKHGQRVEDELEADIWALENLRKQPSLHTRRIHRQVRRDLQILSARVDRLEKVARDLQQGPGDLVTERKALGALEDRVGHILQEDNSVTEPGLNMSLMKVMVDKQASRLSNLSTEVSARGRMIDRHLWDIEHLENQVSDMGEQRPPTKD